MKNFIVVMLFATCCLTLYSQDRCRLIVKTQDKFAEYPTYRSPGLGPIVIFKAVPNGQPSRSTALFTAYGNTPTLNGNDVILLLANGEKVQIPADVEVRVNRSSSKGAPAYEYTAAAIFTPELYEKLSTVEITDFRIYIFDRKIGKKASSFIRDYIACLKEIN